jgi:pimeloyl-ACP methyl ester carboxylesterase
MSAARAPVGAAEIRLATTAGELAVLHWPQAGAPRVLCLHGWLDNAASFVPLSHHLPGLDLVALDLPGHGRSAHRPANAHYYFTEYLWAVDAALDALRWDCCHLMGHSMGGAVASMYAVAAPDRVGSLVLLDGLGPITATGEQCAERLKKSLHSVRTGPRGKKSYHRIDDMVTARMAVDPDLSEAAARLICERSARQKGRHYEWSYDTALHWVSPFLLTEEQVLGYLQHIEAAVLSITATPFARYVGEKKFRQRTRAIVHGRHELLRGKHHFHMDQPAAVAAMVQAFILEQDKLPQDEP